MSCEAQHCTQGGARGNETSHGRKAAQLPAESAPHAQSLSTTCVVRRQCSRRRLRGCLGGELCACTSLPNSPLP